MPHPLHTLCLRPGDSVRRALEVIDAGGAEIALICDASDVMLGTLTDGDIRRALLRGATLETPVDGLYQHDFAAVREDAGRAAVLDLMHARRISQIPVLDSAGRLVGLHLLRELVGSVELPNAAVIMAGGRGTRLQPLTLAIPKPMLPVAGRPILERIVLHLVGSGVRTVFLAVNYMADVIEDHFGDGSTLGCAIAYLREDPGEPLGTAGALALLPDAVRSGDDSVLVMNGDLIAAFSVQALLHTHRSNRDVITVGLSSYTHQVPYGVVHADGSRLVEMVEKPTERWTVNAGVYAVSPTALRHLPHARVSYMPDLVATCAAAGERVGVHMLEGDWQDVGRAPDLRLARGEAP